jgi:potassium/chloride transporter 9
MSSSPLLRKENTNARSSTSLRNYNTISRPTNNLGNDCRSSKYLPISPQSGSSPYESRSNSRKNYVHHAPHLSSKSNHEKKNKDKKSTKLGTLNGVTLPTILNVLSILMFLRFGFIIGQMGILGTIFLLLISYGINLLTTLSISAIATNGTVKGGGAYYMLSRSLGVEFGGAIGVIFYIGQILNSSMNVAGLIEPILFNFAIDDGSLIKFLPIGYWWQFFYCSILLMLCIIVALIGSSAVSKAGTYLCLILILSTLSIPISALFVKPFTSEYGIDYSGLSIRTFKENLLPNFTKGAAGSQIKGIETFNDLFGIFFPATAGILAGASMSGDLKNPSKSIPKGTLNGLLTTFTSYFIVILSMGASIPRSLLYKDTQVLQTINLSPFIILAGEFSTSIFSIIVGIVGAAKLLQAIARDQILPGLKIFGNGDSITDDPKEAIILTWIICQLFLFADLNQIATFITMAFLMTFIVTNLSCALLKIGSAPNFRPSFKYFSTKSALSGTIGCLIAMFVVDGISATIIFVTLILLILFIHFVSPPKTWGDVSQSLIYHQVRKYLLKLRQDNVKYWRPQILLLVDNPRTSWKLISFCNNLKKGGLYVLGHVFVINKFQDNVNELNKNKDNWIKIRDITKVKAFVQISIAPTFIWGVRNIYLGSGLGGMKPNITITGFYDLARYQGKYKLPKGLEFESLNLDFQKQVKIDINELPTDQRAKFAPKIKLTEWIEVLEDLSLLNSNIAVARGFARLDIPNNIEISNNNFKKKQYIDLYPIQMAQKLDSDKGVLTTNFDTCTLILQMGAILHTVPNWKKTHIIRVIVFVEEEKDVKEERIRVKKLLEILRMQDSEIVVISLENSDLKVYNYISKGDEEGLSNKEKERIHELLKEDEWWGEVVKIREGKKGRDILNKNSTSNNLLGFDKGIHHQTFTIGGGGNFGKDKENNKLLKNKHIGNGSRRMTMSRINQLGISLGKMSFQTNKFTNKDIRNVLVDDTDGSVSDLESINSEYSIQSNVSGRPIIETSISNESVLQMKKKKKGAFTAERMPNSTVKEDAEGNEISIMFEEDGDGYDNGEIEEYNEGRDELISSGEEVEFSVAFGDMTRRCQFLVLNEMMKNLSYSIKNTTKSKSTLISTPNCGKDMMTTALIFSTLPAPEVGTHLNEKECVAYAVDVSLWTTGLPATLLLNAKTVTVTSAL